MWSLRWHFTNKYVAGHLAVLKVTVTVCHTAKHYGEEYDDWNSAVLRSRRYCSSDGAERTDDGRAFHAPAAVTEKARSPSVVRRVVGMTSVDVEALRRRRREPTSAVERRVSARYDGAVPVRQWYTRTHNRNWILSGTFSLVFIVRISLPLTHSRWYGGSGCVVVVWSVAGTEAVVVWLLSDQ